MVANGGPKTRRIHLCQGNISLGIWLQTCMPGLCIYTMRCENVWKGRECREEKGLLQLEGGQWGCAHSLQEHWWFYSSKKGTKGTFICGIDIMDRHPLTLYNITTQGQLLKPDAGSYWTESWEKLGKLWNLLPAVTMNGHQFKTLGRVHERSGCQWL